MRDVNIAITAASYSGNKGAAAMLQSSINQLYKHYGDRLNIYLMSVYPEEDQTQIPFDFIKIIECKPEQLLFLAFPLAIIHYLFRWCFPVCWLLEKNTILKTYTNIDMVIDEAGISFVDSRGIIMNVYAFVCAAVPLLMGAPVVKYSQAMGPFHNPLNRILAKWILPHLRLICARGQKTLDNLSEIGIFKNVILCADGAFTMEDSPLHTQCVNQICNTDPVFFKNKLIVGISLSSVVERKCQKIGIDYKQIMISFIDYLIDNNYKVLLIANAARIHSTKARNNDLIVCDAVYKGIAKKENVRWYHKEMAAEEVREYISKCHVLVASRFHAMIGALEKQIPVLLVGWSHKYQEVLEMFKLGPYAIDYSTLELENLKSAFEDFIKNRDIICKQLASHHTDVLTSSRNNIQKITEILDQLLPLQPRKGLFDYRNPDKYMGTNILCRKGYASSAEIRENAASGGVITALLCHMLESGEIDGAWVTKSEINHEQLGYHTWIATTTEEIISASSSIYMDMPLLRHLDMVRQFPGKIAVVLTPCMMKSLQAVIDKDADLQSKIVLKIGLFCSGNHKKEATLLPLKKQNISLKNANRIYYRKGHWRGISSMMYNDKTTKSFSYTKTICAYKNAFFFEKKGCMYCQDHFSRYADISMGDIWLNSMKKEAYKHTCCIIRNKKAKELYEHAVLDGAITDSHISRMDVLDGQKRALVFKFHCANAKETMQSIDTTETCRWNHKLVFYIAEKNRSFSEKHYKTLQKIPLIVIYYYMCFIRLLLSF